MHIVQDYLSYFSNFAFSLFWFLVMLTIVVFIHEYGHYLVARLCGVRINSFSLGFGKELFGWNDKQGTRWKISLLPLGGYVKMHGDADPASSPDFKKLKKLSIKDREQSFYYKSLPQKAAIVVAGPFANYLLAILIMWVMFSFYGKMVTSPEITMVQEGSPASKAGIKLGDKITKMDGKEIKYFEELKQIIVLNTGEPIETELLRNDEKIKVVVTPIIKKSKDIFGNDIDMPLIGVAATKYEFITLDVFSGLGEAVKESISISAGVLKAVWQMVSGARSLEQLGGPIKMAQYSGQSAKVGIQMFFWFIALISINLGLINLFPIPMLDGGHILYYIVEYVTGKPVAERIQLYGARIGFAMLAMIMLIACFNDLKGLIASF